MKLIAAIPVYNSVETLPRVIAAVCAQTVASRSTIVVDDGSTDSSAATAALAGALVVKLGANLGRGAARARALAEADADFVFMSDATMKASPDFTAIALPWFDDPQVAAVFGRIVQPAPRTVAERWRGRHVFKTEIASQPRHHALLATGLCVLRTQAVREVGSFDPALRAGEDADLGRRLLAAGWDVIADPRLIACDLRGNSAFEVLARYARWNWPHGLRGRAWRRQMAYAFKVMAAEDVRAGDPLAAFLSLASPFFRAKMR